jgi:hypothetical protein
MGATAHATIRVREVSMATSSSTSATTARFLAQLTPRSPAG